MDERAFGRHAARSAARPTGPRSRSVDEAGPEDTGAAIAAAYDAFHGGPWRDTSARERGDLLLRVADLLERDAGAVARAESLRHRQAAGRERVRRRRRGLGVPATTAASPPRTPDGSWTPATPTWSAASCTSRVGVCGLIAPWNYPLLQASWKVAPCLAAGNTFVLKPSELTPHTAIHLMRLLEEAGLPAGVGNLVLGAGPAGRGAARRPTRASTWSPSPAAWRPAARVMAGRGATVKKVALELGGKNPNIVFADADLDVALDFALTAVFLHSGQVCSAGARLVLEESLHDAFVDALVERAAAIRLGGPFDEKAETGPLISAAHREKVAAYVAEGHRRGRGAALRWPAARGPGPRQRLLLPAHRPGRVHQRRCR